MEKTRYFRNSNQLNVIVNILSGNLFPLGDGNKRLSFLAVLWIICMWGVKITYFWTGVLGSLYFSDLTTEDVIKKSGAMGVLSAEVIFPTIYLNLRRKAFTKLINEYNNILIDSEHLRRAVLESLEPYKKGLRVYMFACFFATSSWSAAPILRIFNEDQFTYEDFTVPAYAPGSPFGKNVFVAGAVFQVFGSCSMHFGKISVDLYVIHFIAVLAAQFKFAGEELARALSDENGKKDDAEVLVALHHCVRYHAATIQNMYIDFSSTTLKVVGSGRGFFRSVIIETATREGPNSRLLKSLSTLIGSLPIMEKNQYFRSSNQLNAIVNILSGHLFPLGDGDSRLNIFAKLWIICMWGVKFTYFWTAVLGSLHFAGLTSEEIFKHFGVLAVLFVEVLFPTVYLNFRRKELKNLIKAYNRTLIDSEHLRRCVRDTLEPYKKSLRMYMLMSFATSFLWSGAPILRAFNEDRFVYKDFAVPAYLPGAPFDKTVFVVGSIFQIFGNCSYDFGKISVDLYVIHLVTVLAALYKFSGEELGRALSDENGKKDDVTVLAAIQQCVQYHADTIQYL